MCQLKKNAADVENDENMHGKIAQSDVECRKCHKKGLFAVACRNGQAVHTITEVLSDSDSQDCVFLGEVSTQTTKPWIVKVTLKGDAVNFKI